MIKVAVFDTKPYDRSSLTEAGAARVDWVFMDARLSATSAGLAQGCRGACIFVNDCATAPVLEALGRLGLGILALRCAGHNQVDLPAADRLGLRVTRVPAYSPYSVSEHTLALLLALNRKIHRAHLRVMEHDFRLQGLLGWDLHGKVVGVVGTGRIGKLVAQAFGGFGCQVLATDPLPDPAWAQAHGVSYVAVNELLTRSDVITLHTPLTPETRHMIDAASLASMKDGAYLINTSRGALVDTAALVEALRRKKLGGVALDVYEEEEGVFFEDHSFDVLEDELARLLSFPNVLVTSHQAYFTQEALAEIGRMTVDNLCRFEAGSPAVEGTQLTRR
jgi:D-lactate dehydrogenase